MMDVANQIRGWKEPLLWTSACLVFFVLCLILTFPFGVLQHRIITDIERNTGISLRAAEWDTRVPLGLAWNRVTVTAPSWPPLEVGRVEAHVGLLKALAGELVLDLHTQLDGQSPAQGTATSTVNAPSWSLAGPLSVQGTVRHVELAKLFPAHITRGALTGTFTHRLENPTEPLTAESHWQGEVKDLAVERIPLANGRTLSVSFNVLSMVLDCQHGRCAVTELKGDGTDGSFTMEGTVTLQQPLPQSQLALSLTVIPGPGFAAQANELGIPPLPPGTPMTVKVAGTLAQPRITL